MLLSHKSDCLHFFERQTDHIYIIQVNKQDPVFDLAGNEQFFLNEREKESRCSIKNFVIVVAFDDFANV